MGSHDSIKELSDILNSQELIKKISPKFNELSLDIQEVSKYSKNPIFLATLLFKLAEEREKTNKMLADIFDKFDSIMLNLKTGQTPFAKESMPVQENKHDVSLAEQDQIIMHLARANGQVTADLVKAELGYKGKNAASQRLNRLFKDGHLRKTQAGRKVLYLAKSL
ncbi:MAG: hypothetical protein JW744_04685 [Candidatus Diapherotrites archaeon]|uniref:Uncharacterized protein n=1 Tax=Candidatus Iainarchaeum sp. TaxID=3101447 RepID=A0A938YYM3_9ARCH|nr:hypothetical protein [Candidatus Diapherotrites archaeon]